MDRISKTGLGFFTQGHSMRFVATFLLMTLTHGIYAGSLWRVSQNDSFPQTGTVVESSGFHSDVLRIQNTDTGDVAITENGPSLLFFGAETTTLLGTSGDWVWANNLSQADATVYAKTRRSAWQAVPDCPDLIAGGSRQKGIVRCAENSIQFMSGAAVERWIAVPAGHKLRHIISESRVLLERESDARYLIAKVLGNALVIDTSVNFPALPSAPQRLSFFKGETIGPFNREMAGLQLADQYAILSNNNLALVPFTGTPELSGQCLTTFFTSAPGFTTVENINGQRHLLFRYLPNIAPSTDLVLGTQDQALCLDRGLSQGLWSTILHPSADGDELRWIPATVTYKANDALLGAGHIMRSDNEIYVRFPDGIIRRREFATGSLITLQTDQKLSGHKLSIAAAADSTLKETFLNIDPASGFAQIAQRTRAASNGAETAVRHWILPIDLSAGDVSRTVDGLTSTDVSDPGVFVLRYSTQGQSLRMLLAQDALPGRLRAFTDIHGQVFDASDGVFAAGDKIYAINQRADNTSQIYRWNFSGALQASSIAPLTGTVYPFVTGNIIFQSLTQSGTSIAGHDGQNVLWQRSVAAGCRMLAIDAFPLLACDAGATALEARLSRLDPLTGSTIWSRLITPLDTTEVWLARYAWLEGATLKVLADVKTAVAFGQQIRLSAARLDPATGALSAVGPTRVLPMANRSGSFSVEGSVPVPFDRRFLRVTAQGEGVRERLRIEVDQSNNVLASPLGYTQPSPKAFITETQANSVSNEGVRWFSSAGFQFQFETTARGPMGQRLTQPLTIELRQSPVPTSVPNSQKFDLRVQNPNSEAASEARIYLSGMRCESVDNNLLSVVFDVGALSTAVFQCTVTLHPDEITPLQFGARLRQPLNFDGYYPNYLGLLSEAYFTLSNTRFVNGFED
jgi:hypothetical protein